MENEKIDEQKEEIKPNDVVTLGASDFLKITDVDTGEELLSKRG